MSIIVALMDEVTVQEGDTIEVDSGRASWRFNVNGKWVRQRELESRTEYSFELIDQSPKMVDVKGKLQYTRVAVGIGMFASP